MRRSEDGQALLLTLAVLFLLTLLGAAGLTLATGSKQASMGERERLQALYIAEAGVEKALADLKQRRLIYPAPGFESFRIANEPYAGGVIEEVYVKKETVGNSVYYTITSVGKYPEESRPGRLQARKIVKAKVLVGPDPFLAYGGPGPKSDTQVEVKGPIMILGESNIQGSLLARTGDVALESLELEHQGGIYAGGNVRAGRDFTFSGRGEIKAGKDVDLFNASMRTWEGEIWAGNEVYLPPGLPGNVIVHKNCGPRIPGFPLPQFPVVGKGSPWYGRVRKEAQDQGRYFPNAAAWLDDDPEFGTGKGIRWNYSVRLWPKTVLVVVRGAELNLEGITVIDGPLALDAAAYQEAYRRWQERIRSRYPGKTVKFRDADLRKLELRANTAATVVADSIAVDSRTSGRFGVDTSGINAPLGLFAASGAVTYYNAPMGPKGRLSVLATGEFKCQMLSSTSLNLDWVAAQEKVVIQALIVVNEAQAAVPPGTPVGYRIVSGKVT